MRMPLAFIALLLASTAVQAQDEPAQIVEKPAAILADGIPPIPVELAAATRPYFEYRSAGFRGWNAQTRAMLISTRFGDTSQLHEVAIAGGARTQLTFEEEPIGGASLSPDGAMLLIEKDSGGSEFDQLYRYEDGRLIMLTDGTSRNNLTAWTDDGSRVAFRSTKRNGRDIDLYVMDPRDPASAQMLGERQGGGWYLADFSPNARHALVGNYISVTNTELYLRDLATGEEKRLTDPDQPTSFSGTQFAPDGTLWTTADAGSDFKRLGTLDTATGAFTAVVEEPWDVAGFDISDDGSFIAYEINEAGRSTLKILDVASGIARTVALPPGVIGTMEIAPWGEIGFTFSSNQSTADAYSVNPQTLAVTRWTTSEMGGLDPLANVLPELVEITSFDGEQVSGFLYRPDPTRFAGPRPLIVDIHGGPEGQSVASFQGRANYLINELGVAIFEPNVCGSTGFGKRFVALDNGPFLRENSVLDIGAFLDALAADSALDSQRVMVTGGSYGGYMCYASAIRYGARLRGAACVVAISDFVTFLENTEDYRRDLRRVEYGDERDPVQRAKLIAISPLTRVDELAIPLFVATGANDPRVPA